MEADLPLNTLLFALRNIIAAAEGGSPLGALPSEHRAILTFLAARTAEGTSPCLGDVANHGEFGVPVTASKRLRDLESAGWIRIVQDPTNHRRRLIELTPKSLGAYNQVSRTLAGRLPAVGQAGAEA